MSYQHAKRITLPPPPPARQGRKGREMAALPYQSLLTGQVRVDRVRGAHTQLLALECGECGDKTPKSGFAPVFDDFSHIYRGRPIGKQILLCNRCWWEY